MPRIEALGRLTCRSKIVSAFTLTRHRWVRRRGLLDDLLAQAARAAATCPGPPQNDRRSDKDRGVGSDDHADDNRERKVVQDRAAEKEQAEDRNERDRAGQEGPAQRLVDACVHDLFDTAALAAGQTFTD